ncbi:MAG: LysR family transcriptional regulator [Pseudomonadota bacterium]
MLTDWDKLRVFNVVAEAGSFTHASERLNLSQSAVSRQISALEDDLSMSLFHRHARGLILTEQGETLHRTTREMYAKLSMTEANLAEGKGEARGPLAINTTVAFGSTWLAPRLRTFIETYPGINVNMILNDRGVDLSMRQADVAVWLSQPRQQDLIQRVVGHVNVNLYGSKEYLEAHGTPEKPEDLKEHELILFDDGPNMPIDVTSWIMTMGDAKPGDRNVALRMNNQYAIYRAVRSGLGLAPLPDYMVDPGLNVVKVMPDYQGPTLDVYYVYPEELRHARRIAVFRDFLMEHLAEGGLA